MSSETVSIQLGVENILKRMNHDISKAYGDFCDTGSFAGSIGSATYYVGITALNAFLTKEDVVFNFTVKNASGCAATKNTVYKFLDKYGIEDISDIEVEGDDFEQPEHSIRMSVFKVKVYISKDLFKKQARQYCTSSDLVPISKWKPYTFEEIRPLYLFGRWNGGKLAFKYNKKDNSFIITSRGVYSPTVYTRKQQSDRQPEIKSSTFSSKIFYKMYTSTGGIAWLLKDDALKYFEDGLPGAFVDHYEE